MLCFVYHSGRDSGSPHHLEIMMLSHTGAKHQLFTENHDFPGFRGGLVTPSRLSSLSFLRLSYFHTIPDKSTIKISFIVKEVKFERREHSCALMPVAEGTELYLN